MAVQFPGQFSTPLGYVQAAAGTINASQTLTQICVTAGLAGIPKGATYALIQAEAVTVRWRDDGTAPTAAIGMLMPIGEDPIGVVAGSFRTIRFIGTAASAILNISFYS